MTLVLSVLWLLLFLALAVAIDIVIEMVFQLTGRLQMAVRGIFVIIALIIFVSWLGSGPFPFPHLSRP